MASHLALPISPSTRLFASCVSVLYHEFQNKQCSPSLLLNVNRWICSYTKHGILLQRNGFKPLHYVHVPCQQTKFTSPCIQLKNFTTELKSQSPRFQNSDKCLVFDKNDALVNEATFSEAKAIASENKSRLVYMHKNADGIYCFKLQALRENFPIPVLQQPLSHESKSKQKRNSVKEFKIKSSISNNDLNIKISKIYALLTKGKPVTVLICKVQSSSMKDEKSMISKFSEQLKEVCIVQEKYNNASVTCVGLTPREQHLTD